MDTVLLEILRLFARTGTLSTVSERMHLTEPTVSRAMRKLEEHLDVELFQRGKNRIALNETGKLAVVYAENILKTEQEMREQLQLFSRKAQQISIGSCTPGPLMEMLPLAAGLYGELPITTEIAEEEALAEGLRNHRYSLVLSARLPEDPGLLGIPYVSETLKVSLDPDDPDAVRDSITFAELDGREFVTYLDIGCWDRILREKMPRATLYRQESMKAVEKLACASRIPVFSTDITQRILGPVNPSRTDVSISDPEAALQFYLILKKEDKGRFRDLLSVVKESRDERSVQSGQASCA